MDLSDIIKNLPKITDVTKRIEQKIIKINSKLSNSEKQINSNENQIKMILDIDIRDKYLIDNLDILIQSNLNELKLQTKLILKISELKNSLNSFNTDKIYPTEWEGGKVLGEIIETDDGYRVIYDGQSRSFKYKNIINSPKMFGCIDKSDCKIQASKYLYDYYDNLNKISNKYRFVNFNTIEIQLTQGKTFITDSKFLELINKYRIGLKYDARYDKYYITYIESPKIVKLFTELAFGMTRPKTSNNCDFDLREENLIESDNSKIIKLDDTDNNPNGKIKLKIKLNQDGLEMYKWIRGKYAGTVFQRSNQLKWTVVVKKTDGTVSTKTLPFTEETKNSVYEEAIKIRNGLSDAFDLTTNKIKIINEDTIEVKLTKDQIMTTDYKFLNTVEKYPLFSSKSEGENSKYYVSMMVGKEQRQFHNFITSWVMVDHIDRNPMNNCLSNLREATHKINNNNRSKSESSNAIELGVTYSAKDDAYKARIKQDGREICKQYSVKKYGKDEALRLAIETRRDFNRAFNCLNG
jgi:hypothetical protein